MSYHYPLETARSRLISAKYKSFVQLMQKGSYPEGGFQILAQKAFSVLKNLKLTNSVRIFRRQTQFFLFMVTTKGRSMRLLDFLNNLELSR
ncbi:MAG: hypothetical protein A2520_04980 [Deltaproteobacteria bacterium RIFOXYD12_FULL_53_23]|nr:MAG: hypothetical protein A2520_04980 [Deltaproteobacteria bacterium RIFOXYD12_FULL_53_23]